MTNEADSERAELAATVREVLVGKTKRDDQVEAIVALIEGIDRVHLVREVYPDKTRVEVERVAAYGMVVGLDANGEACRVEFPYGAYVDE